MTLLAGHVDFSTHIEQGLRVATLLPGLIDMHMHLTSDPRMSGYKRLEYTDTFFTNVLVYARDSASPKKQALARSRRDPSAREPVARMTARATGLPQRSLPQSSARDLNAPRL